MPTILTHAALPLITAWGLGRGRISGRVALAGAVLAVAPDLDVLGRLLEIPHTDPLGHRGISHSLLFALVLAGLAMLGTGRDRPLQSAAFLFAAAASHGIADMLTAGGKGIMLWWPLSDARYIWAERPVEVSGILARSISSGRLPYILWTELLWLWVPALLVAALLRWKVQADIDLPKGQS